MALTIIPTLKGCCEDYMENAAPYSINVFGWRHKAKPPILGHSGSKKSALKGVEKTPKVVETFKLVECPTEAKLPHTDESPKEAEPCVTELELGHECQSLLWLPRTAVQSVSTLMVSALQTGWQLCSWKSSVSSASIASQMRTRSPLDTPEAEMLREVYLVLWAIRKQLRQLVHRQERHRRRHRSRTHTVPQPDPVQSLKQDARSPL